MARHVGGAVNYMAVSEVLDMERSVFSAGLAADDLILTLYFTAIYTLAKNIPREEGAEVSSSTAGTGTTAVQTAAKAPDATGSTSALTAPPVLSTVVGTRPLKPLFDPASFFR
jgi:uncharacterized membrane protein